MLQAQVRSIENERFLIPLILLTVLGISFFSGYRSIEVPLDLAWQFSPLGLLSGVTPQNAALPSVSYFAGTLTHSLAYLFVFLKTCFCESLFYFICFRRLSFEKRLAALLGGNIMTHPFVFFVIPLFFKTYLASALCGEAFAAFSEMALAFFILRGFPIRHALAGAVWILIANLFSWEVGMYL